MSPSRSISTRFLAVLLPACFVWTAVACVTLCLKHSREAQQGRVSAAIDRIAGVDDGDCCPISRSPTTALPRRASLIQPSCSDAVLTTRPAVIVDHRRAEYEADRSGPSYSDPPFERLRNIRI
jgi:hypothetical protein